MKKLLYVLALAPILALASAIIVPAGTPTIGGPINGGATDGSIIFVHPDGELAQDNANLFWDFGSKFLGIGTDIPAYTLDVDGDFQVSEDVILTQYTTGSIPFIGASGLLSQDNARLFWDSGNFRLGLGTSSPSTQLHTTGGVRFATFGTAGVLHNDATGVLSSSLIVNADVAAAGVANIARNKMASGTAYRILANDSGGTMSENAVLTADHVLIADSNGQITGEQRLSLSRTAAGASANVLIGAGPASSPAYGLIADGNISGSAAISRAKIAAGTADHVIVNDGTGALASVAQLPLSQGGTNKDLTPVNGGVLYTDANSAEVSAAGSSGQILRSAGAAAPTWSTATYPDTGGSAGNVLVSDGTNFSATSLNLADTDAVGASVLPIANGGTNSSSALSNNRVMISSGSAIVEHSALTQNQIVYPGATGLPTGEAAFTYDPATNTQTVDISLVKDELQIEDSDGGTNKVTVQASTSLAGDYTLTLPLNDGNSADFLQTDGSGVLSWVAAASFHPITQVFTASGTYNRTYAFRISTGSATAGDTYTNNGVTFTIVETVASGTILFGRGNNVPASSGTLTRTSGSGDATITFSAYSAPLYVLVTCVGGGGGSGGVALTGSGEAAEAGGGGGGGTAIVRVPIASVGVTETVTVGAGGVAGTAGANTGGTGDTSSFGADCVAEGGAGGNGGTATSSSVAIGGGNGGIGTTGDILLRGGKGNTGRVVAATTVMGNNGGYSTMGGPSSATAGNSSGAAGQLYGGGATGARNGQNQSARAGSAGGDGIVTAVEFYQ